MYNLTVFETKTNRVLWVDQEIDIGTVVCNIMDVMTESMRNLLDDVKFENGLLDKIEDSRESFLDNGAIKLEFNGINFNTRKVYGVDDVTYLIEEV